jgi:hypothetical protein
MENSNVLFQEKKQVSTRIYIKKKLLLKKSKNITSKLNYTYNSMYSKIQF